MKFYYVERMAWGGTPQGVTITKKPKLPEYNFRITEYCWPNATLWFVDEDKFSADERQAAYYAYMLETYVEIEEAK